MDIATQVDRPSWMAPPLVTAREHPLRIPGGAASSLSSVRRYRRARHRIIRAIHATMFELGVAQIVVGLGLWVMARPWHPTEPSIILAMSALALVFSGITTAAVAATDEG